MRCFTLLLVLLFLATQATASERWIDVTVVSKEGPVAGAKVWVRQYLRGGQVSRLAGPFVSAKDGRARVAIENNGISLYVYGKDNQGKLGLARLERSLPDAKDMCLHLGSPLDLEGKITSKGTPAAGVKCTLLEYYSKFADGLPLPWESVFSNQESISDKNGIIRFKNVPPSTDATIRIQSDSFAWGTGMLFHNKANSFEMVEHGELEFQFQGATQAINDKMIRWSLRQNHRGNEAKNFSREHTQNDGINKDFPVTPLKNIASGSYKLTLDPLPNCPYTFENLPESVEIQKGKKTLLEIAVRPAIAIEGRFLDRGTGKGVPDLGLSVVRFDGKFLNHSERFDGRSDEKGEFRIYVKRSGNYRLFFGRYGTEPLSHIPPVSGTAEDRVINPIQVTEGEVTKLPDLRLSTAVEVSGKIQETGRNNQDAVYEIFSDSLLKVDQSKVKALGEFTISGFTSDSPATIYIRHGRAVNIPENREPGQYQPLSSFAVNEKNAVRVSGIVLDTQANPVPNAQVSFYLNNLRQGIGGSPDVKYLGTILTAKDGKYEYGALWPNVNYELIAYCSGFEAVKGAGPRVTGKPGETIKDVKLTLKKKASAN